MLIGHIHTPNTYEPFLQHPVWQKVLTWLNTEAPKLQDGEYEIDPFDQFDRFDELTAGKLTASRLRVNLNPQKIDGRNIYAPISTVQTIPREEAKYEAHRQYIDVHYCLEGGEIIEWTPVNQLTPTMEFDTAKDYCLYESPKEATSLVITPGTFAIFFLADAHMPKISDGKNKQVRKVVVKIKQSILWTLSAVQV